MARTCLESDPCPVARTLDRVGGWWSMLILRDALFGRRRFDEFEKSLGIAPNMLSRRLADLAAAGFLEKRPYSERPLRHEYAPTVLAQDFRPVLDALATFGTRNFPLEREDAPEPDGPLSPPPPAPGPRRPA